MKKYKYSRGDKFSCTVAIDESGRLMFHNVSYPPDATSEVMDLFFDEAEQAAMKQYEKESEGKYGAV